jgi:Kef-type K+ transport system membrane component KefB
MSTNLITLAEHELARFFFAIALLLILAHSLGYVFSRLKLPKVIGEIGGGLLLGPTVVGHLAPAAYTWLFDAFAYEGKLISMVYWLGLVLLMFVSGFEIKMAFDRKDKKIIVALLVGSTVPFAAGWVAPYFFDFSPLLGEKQNMLALKIVIGIAGAVTSIPVISTIFMPKLLPLLNGNRYNLLKKSSGAGYVLFLCFLFSAFASWLNVNIIFGAFLAGVAIGVLPQARFRQEKAHIKEIALALFTPLYFAVVGLKLDWIHQFDLKFFLVFLLFTSVFQTIGTLIAARLIKKGWLSSFNFAIAITPGAGRESCWRPLPTISALSTPAFLFRWF